MQFLTPFMLLRLGLMQHRQLAIKVTNHRVTGQLIHQDSGASAESYR